METAVQPPAPRSADPDALARRFAEQVCAAGGEWIQTHISHVFLAGERVFKLRKAVALSFLDFHTRAQRNADCEREIALNRRLAPELYLGVATLAFDDGEVVVGPLRERVDDANAEHVVVMRRLPSGSDARSLLARDALTPESLRDAAERLADFHDANGLGRPAPWDADAWRARMLTPTLQCLDALDEHASLDPERRASLRRAVIGEHARLAPRFEARRRDGRAVDGHGDLHLEHLWFGADGAPIWIDCIEFDPELRRIDRAAEIAFLAMDLRYRGRPDLAEHFLGASAVASDDYDAFPVVDFFAAYRALVRAKVAALASGQPGIAAAQRAAARESVDAHVALAEALLDRPRDGGLVVTCGTVGSGKSTVARRLAAAGGGIPIVSDRVRKHRAGIAAAARRGDDVDRGMYAPEERAAVYRGLLERAAPVVASGRTAILDASFASRAERDRARRWARDHGVSARLVEVRCAPDEAERRLAARVRAGRDASDAGPAFLATHVARFEAPDEWPAADREVVWTHPARSHRSHRSQEDP